MTYSAHMSREYIITMTAENRVGILAAVTNAMGELGAELLEGSQTVVSGYFTMIFAAEFPDNRESQVVLDHLHDVCRPFGIHVTLTEKSETAQSPDDSSSLVRRLSLSGRNVRGILRHIAVKMSLNQIDVLGLHAWREADDRFEMVMKILVPESFDEATLPAELAGMNPEWDLRVNLEEYAQGSRFTDD